LPFFIINVDLSDNGLVKISLVVFICVHLTLKYILVVIYITPLFSKRFAFVPSLKFHLLTLHFPLVLQFLLENSCCVLRPVVYIGTYQRFVYIGLSYVLGWLYIGAYCVLESSLSVRLHSDS